jgi:hypothetical protein
MTIIEKVSIDNHRTLRPRTFFCCNRRFVNIEPSRRCVDACCASSRMFRYNDASTAAHMALPAFFRRGVARRGDACPANFFGRTTHFTKK